MNYKWYRDRYHPVIINDLSVLPCCEGEKWLSVSDAARLFGVHESTIRNWCFLIHYYSNRKSLSAVSKQRIARIPIKNSVILKREGQKRGKIFVKVTFS